MPSNGQILAHKQPHIGCTTRIRPILFDQNVSMSFAGMIILSGDASIVLIWNSSECFREDE